MPPVYRNLINAYEDTIKAYADEVLEKSWWLQICRKKFLRAKNFSKNNFKVARNNNFVTPCTAEL